MRQKKICYLFKPPNTVVFYAYQYRFQKKKNDEMILSLV